MSNFDELRRQRKINADDVLKDRKPKSVWDEDVDMAKVDKLTPEERHRLFPNDYAPDGKAYTS